MAGSVDVFISYAREDRPQAQRVAKLLTECGWVVWWDDRLMAGSTFTQEIERQLAAARLVIVIWSRASVGSNWVLDEASAARERNVLLPVVIDDAQIPLGFRQTHAADLRRWATDADEPASNLLLETVTTLLRGNPAAVSRQSSDGSGPERMGRVQRRRRLHLEVKLLRRLPLIAVSAAVVVSVVFAAVWVTQGPQGERVFHRQYYQGFDRDGPGDGQKIDDLWHIGLAENNWRGTVRDGHYRLCNEAGDPTLSYINRLTPIVDGKEVDMSDGRVMMNFAVEPPSTTYSGVGILFRATRDSSAFLAVLVNAGAGLSLLQRTPGGMKVLWSDHLDAGPAGLMPLKVEGRGSTVDIYAKGTLVHSHQGVESLNGDAGLFAYGTGCFLVDDIEVYAPMREGRLVFKN